MGINGLLQATKVAAVAKMQLKKEMGYSGDESFSEYDIWVGG